MDSRLRENDGAEMVLTFNPLDAMPSGTEKAGDFSEDCLRALARVPQLPDFLSSAGQPKVMAWGVVYFGYFLLDKQKKVTCCRATPTIYVKSASAIRSLKSLS